MKLRELSDTDRTAGVRITKTTVGRPLKPKLCRCTRRLLDGESSRCLWCGKDTR